MNFYSAAPPRSHTIRKLVGNLSIGLSQPPFITQTFFFFSPPISSHSTMVFHIGLVFQYTGWFFYDDIITFIYYLCNDQLDVAIPYSSGLDCEMSQASTHSRQIQYSRHSYRRFQRKIIYFFFSNTRRKADWRGGSGYLTKNPQSTIIRVETIKGLRFDYGFETNRNRFRKDYGKKQTKSQRECRVETKNPPIEWPDRGKTYIQCVPFKMPSVSVAFEHI